MYQGSICVSKTIDNSSESPDDRWITKAILDASTPFYRLSPEGQLLYANKAACENLGYSNEELIGLHPWDFNPDIQPEHWPAIWEQLKTHKIVQIETRHSRNDGTIIDVAVTSHYIVHEAEEFCFSLIQNITERKAAEEKLRTRESYLRALIDNFPFMVWLKDRDSRFLAVNQVMANNFGYRSPQQLVGKTDFDLSPFDLASHYREDDRKIMDTRQRRVIEEMHETAGGRRWIETFKAPVLGRDGEIYGTVGFARDITERKQAESDLHLSATVFDSYEAMVVTDENCEILRVNDAFCRITGYEPDEVIGRNMSILSSGMQSDEFYKGMWESISTKGGWQGEIWNRRKNGEIYPQWLTISAIKGKDGVVTNYVGTMLDITQRKAAEEQMNYRAHHDPLTDLPNRALLMDRLRLALAQSKRDGSLLCFMYVDLDRFKEVNDTFGHGIGDLLLKEVAKRLLECVRRETDTVARLGGDEFAVLLPKVDKEEDIAVIGSKILDAMNEMFMLQGNSVQISASIGIALYPLHASTVEALIEVADKALYEAKEDGKNCFRIAPA
jgi:diguanylate cyclase (GGDEF)-like protein/PAS domain S-box-containing protein